MTSNPDGTLKWTVIGVLITAAGVIIALFAWIHPFSPPSPPTPPPTTIIIPTVTPTPSPTPSPTPLASTPTTTINTFCNALYNQEYDTAYNQLSDAVQQNTSEQTFRSQYNQVRCLSFSKWVQVKGGWEITITFAYFSGQYPPTPYCTYDLYPDSNSIWKISSINCT